MWLLLLTITTVRPEQIHSWRQVNYTAHMGGPNCASWATDGSGTRLRWEQVQAFGISPDGGGIVIGSPVFHREFRVSGAPGAIKILMIGMTPNIWTDATLAPTGEFGQLGRYGNYVIGPARSGPAHAEYSWDGRRVRLVSAVVPSCQ